MSEECEQVTIEMYIIYRTTDARPEGPREQVPCPACGEPCWKAARDLNVLRMHSICNRCADVLKTKYESVTFPASALDNPVQ